MRKIFVIVTILLMVLPSMAQKNGKPNLKKLSKDEAKKLESAEYFYSGENYLRALPEYLDLMNAHPEDLYFKYKSGICFLYKSDEKEKAVTLLKEVETADSLTPEIDFYL